MSTAQERYITDSWRNGHFAVVYVRKNPSSGKWDVVENTPESQKVVSFDYKKDALRYAAQVRRHG